MNLHILPDDIQRIIFKYISNNSSNLIRDAIKTDKFKLKYVRKFIFDEIGNLTIWKELKPSTIGKIYYGDENRLCRTKISKGENIRLRNLNISL
tara:strand:- start:240 stop:521 length:282 start_codon:yes stop_codon:yes gene_type:complete